MRNFYHVYELINHKNNLHFINLLISNKSKTPKHSVLK